VARLQWAGQQILTVAKIRGLNPQRLDVVTHELVQDVDCLNPPTLQ